MMEADGLIRRDRVAYYILLVIAAAFAVVSLCTEECESFLIALPTAIVLAAALIYRGGMYLPPLLVILMSAMMLLLQIAKYGEREGFVIDTAANVVMGAFFDLVGLLMVYSMLKSSPGFDSDRPFFVAFCAACIAFTMSTAIMSIDRAVDHIVDGAPEGEVIGFSADLAAVAVGSTLVSLLFYLNRHNGLFAHTVDKFLRQNADRLGISERERETVREEIRGGESSRMEFKSTLRTNLQTGERDPRMEKAVLKTVVAFLNSKGGTLLIGVADDGAITGIDLQSFESRDKLNLHMNNLLTSQIGSEFLPYISYGLVDFGDRSVMRVVCRRSEVPAFLIEGKEKTFYVRSGPSSISLRGMELLYYANHNFGRFLRRRGDADR